METSKIKPEMFSSARVQFSVESFQNLKRGLRRIPVKTNVIDFYADLYLDFT